jgi:hypothetical protein
LYLKNGNVKNKCNDGFDDWIVDSFVGSMLGRYLCFYEKEDVGVVLMMFLDVVMGE